MSSKNQWALLGGPVFAMAIGIWLASGIELPWPAVWCAVITSLCAFWWLHISLSNACTLHNYHSSEGLNFGNLWVGAATTRGPLAEMKKKYCHFSRI